MKILTTFEFDLLFHYKNFTLKNELENLNPDNKQNVYHLELNYSISVN